MQSFACKGTNLGFWKHITHLSDPPPLRGSSGEETAVPRCHRVVPSGEFQSWAIQGISTRRQKTTRSLWPARSVLSSGRNLLLVGVSLISPRLPWVPSCPTYNIHPDLDPPHRLFLLPKALDLGLRTTPNFLQAGLAFSVHGPRRVTLYRTLWGQGLSSRNRTRMRRSPIPLSTGGC